jgi:glycerol-1-phosphate dehydrogenase [NAD(P)+]
MISKITALWDWKRAFNLKLDDYNDFASLISHNSLDILYAWRKEDVKSDEFQYKLTNSLVLSGIAMEIAGSSRPASGGEHLISHALDSLSNKPKMHGLQVGAATYLCSLMQGNRADIVRDFLTVTGFVGFLSKAPISKKDFVEALKKAPSLKSNYYTVLSEQGFLDKALNFINTDKILKRIIK